MDKKIFYIYDRNTNVYECDFIVGISGETPPSNSTDIPPTTVEGVPLIIAKWTGQNWIETGELPEKTEVEKTKFEQLEEKIELQNNAILELTEMVLGGE
ncbi:hypothetical protein FZW91_02355 [Listeria monocytogenes]|uniref:hypothetical protein n=1 Tax=Listeria monocytogenes TaxID=1639 RepID=UPI0011F0A881|nr:hypothetical protein [Listeria monocytogenes]TYU25345.1 hypothetical protein FZW91_02355 [Listeria monocytogenes]